MTEKQYTICIDLWSIDNLASVFTDDKYEPILGEWFAIAFNVLSNDHVFVFVSVIIISNEFQLM